jgi:protoporphyrinogen oxidase
MDKNLKIAIIGGGPAGLSAAMYLEKKGYDNYVVFEKSDHVGGKCHSPHYNGKRYEMGAIMGVPSYHAVHDIELFAGVQHDGPALKHAYKKANGKRDYQFDPKHIIHIPHLLKVKSQVKKFGELLETKYKGYDVTGHIGVANGHYDGFACTPEREHISGDNPNLKDLSMPFDDFLKKNNLPLVKEVWVQPFTSFGYGYFDEIPTGYVLKYLDFTTTLQFVGGQIWTWKDGTQSIYEALNNKLKHAATLNSDITKIVRKDNKVYITVNGKEEVFDKLIVTAPLQYFPEYADCSDEEKTLFSKIDYERYDTEACIIEKDKYPDQSYYVMENMEPQNLGHVMIYYHRWFNEPDQPIINYVLRHRKGGEELNYDQCCANTIDDMKKLGCPVREENGKPMIINKGKWYYFPHVYSEDYAAGWYDKVEAMQGKNSTFYAGEIMSFGDMDETVEFSHDLVERYF